MKQFECDFCGPVKSVIVDGYPFGDRLLEGVDFVVSMDEKGKITAKTHKSSKGYMEDLNEEKWLKECVKYVKENINDELGRCCNRDGCMGQVFFYSGPKKGAEKK